MFATDAEVPVEPGIRDEALELAKEFADKSREEEGVIEYKISTDVYDPNVIRFFEVYEDDEAFQKHMETDHVEEWQAGLSELQDGELEFGDVIRYDIESVSELEF